MSCNEIERDAREMECAWARALSCFGVCIKQKIVPSSKQIKALFDGRASSPALLLILSCHAFSSLLFSSLLFSRRLSSRRLAYHILSSHAFSPLLSSRRLLQILKPLEYTRKLGSFHVRCTAKGGGQSGQAGAIRLGLARALEAHDPWLRKFLKKLSLIHI